MGAGSDAYRVQATEKGGVPPECNQWCSALLFPLDRPVLERHGLGRTRKGEITMNEVIFLSIFTQLLVWVGAAVLFVAGVPMGVSKPQAIIGGAVLFGLLVLILVEIVYVTGGLGP